MGKNNKKKSAGATVPTEPAPAEPEQKVEADPGCSAEQREVVKKLTTAIKLDEANLGMESADDLRVRLAKSQKIAREFLTTYKNERTYAMQLEVLLQENNIPVPPRPVIAKE